MQSDDVIWSLIGPANSHQFCSYKVKTTTQNFCRNEYNVTGLCNRQSCPLANSRYATVREHQGVLYLYMKTIERAHTPAKMWERIKLSNNYTKALEQIDANLIYWPNFMIHKCKQRVTKITQYLIKMRRLRSKEQVKLVGIKKKLDRREATRERKALSAAHLERSIEAELIARLKSKAYGDAPLNVNEDVWRKVLEAEREELGEGVEEDMTDEDEEDEDEIEDEEEEEEREFVSGESDFESDVEDLEDWEGGEFAEDDSDAASESEVSEASESSASEDEDAPGPSKKRKAPSKKGPKKPAKRRGPHVEVEYEQETEPLTKEALMSW